MEVVPDSDGSYTSTQAQAAKPSPEQLDSNEVLSYGVDYGMHLNGSKSEMIKHGGGTRALHDHPTEGLCFKPYLRKKAMLLDSSRHHSLPCRIATRLAVFICCTSTTLN